SAGYAHTNMSPFSPVPLDLRTLHPELKRPPPPRTTSSSTLRTGHACTHPGIQSLHEFLVRERRGRTTTPRPPGPQAGRVPLPLARAHITHVRAPPSGAG